MPTILRIDIESVFAAMASQEEGISGMCLPRSVRGIYGNHCPAIAMLSACVVCTKCFKDDGNLICFCARPQELRRRGGYWLRPTPHDAQKLNPLRYMWRMHRSKDHGLCAAAFLSQKQCPLGSDCRWRHHPLTEEEVNEDSDIMHRYRDILKEDHVVQDHPITRWDTEMPSMYAGKYSSFVSKMYSGTTTLAHYKNGNSSSA